MRVFVLDNLTIMVDKHGCRIVYLGIVFYTEIIAHVSTFPFVFTLYTNFTRCVLLRILELPQSISIHPISRRTRII